MSFPKTAQSYTLEGEREGEGPYETVGDACPKIWIKPLKEINLGVAWALFYS